MSFYLGLAISEIESTWTLNDLADAHEALDVQDYLEEESLKNFRK